MSKKLQHNPIRIKLLSNHLIHKNNQNIYNPSKINHTDSNLSQNQDKIDFAEYINKQKKFLSKQQSSNNSKQLNQSQSDQSQSLSNRSTQFKYHTKKQLKVQIGQSYTFANSNSNTFRVDQYSNKKYRKQKNCSKKSQNSHHESYQNNKFQYQNNQKIYKKFHTQTMQNQTQQYQNISSGSQQQQHNQIIHQKLEEEMFIKISQQNKLIVKLQEKLYYFQDFCKRLMKNNEINIKKIQILQKQLKITQLNTIKNDELMKQITTKLSNKQKELECFKQKYETAKKTTQNKNNLYQQSKNNSKPYLIKKQKLQVNPMNMIYLNQNDKIQKFNSKALVQSHLTTINNLNDQIKNLIKQNQNLKNELSKMLVVNKKVQNMNIILQKQISELNIKIFQLQRQIEENTYKKYIHNITRIKNLQNHSFR